MDAGQSLNPAIDCGQIEGAFMQGVGLFTLEELITDKQGHLLTTGPLTYKIPTALDIPLEFNVSFLPASGNAKAIYSSKVGFNLSLHIFYFKIMFSSIVIIAVKFSIDRWRATVIACKFGLLCNKGCCATI